MERLRFYGWRIVAVAALAQAISSGTTFFAYGVLLKPIAEEFQTSRLMSVLGLTLLVLVQGLVSPLAGKALDRYSIRTIMLTGITLHALGLVGVSVAPDLWLIGLLFGSGIAIGSYLFGPLATATLVARWFVQKRGQALGWASVGAAIGGFVIPPLVAWIVDIHGWRVATGTLAPLVMVVALPVWLFVINSPEDMHLTPDGAAPGPEIIHRAAPGPASAPAESWLRSRNFWCITASVGLAWAPVSVLLAHLVPYATDLGFPAEQAALLMSTYAACSAAGRLILGSVADRIDKRLALWIVLGLLASGWAMLIGGPPFLQLIGASGLIGLAVGGLMPLWGVLVGACFGRAHFGRIMGLMNPMMLPANLSGGPIAAHVYDRMGAYTLAFSLFLIPLLLAAFVATFLRVPPEEPG